MSVREFDAVDDTITLDDGTMAAVANAAHTFVLLVKPTTLNSALAYLSLATGTGTDRTLYQDTTGALTAGGDLGTDRPMSVGMTASAWQVAGFHVTSSGGTPRGHRKVLGSGSWTHVDAGGVLTANSGDVDNVKVGCFGNSTGFKDFRLAVAAVFTSALTDTDFVNIESNASTAFLKSLSPQALWEFNQASTGTNVLDLMGTGADQTAITGTTVINGDDPAWTFDTGAGAQKTFNAIPFMH